MNEGRLTNARVNNAGLLTARRSGVGEDSIDSVLPSINHGAAHPRDLS